MKRLLLGGSLLALLLVAGCDRQHSDAKSALRQAGAHTLSSFDPPTPGEKITPPHAIKFEQADLTQVLSVYAEISGRSIILSKNLPEVKITFSNQTPMTPVEILQALDTVLAVQKITTVVSGTQYIKVVSANEAPLEAAPLIELQPDQLPDSSSYMMNVVNLKKGVTPDRVSQVLGVFASLPSSIIVIPAAGSSGRKSQSSKTNISQFAANLLVPKGNDVLILRDYSSNVRRMLQMVEKLERQ